MHSRPLTKSGGNVGHQSSFAEWFCVFFLISCRAVLIKVLYAILVLSFVALVWAASAAYFRVRRHMKQPKPEEREGIHK